MRHYLARRFSNKHSKPIAATSKTTMMPHGVVEEGSSFGNAGAGLVEVAFDCDNGTAGTVGGTNDACVGVGWLVGSDFGTGPLFASSSSLPNDAS